MQDVRELCERVLLLDGGKVLRDGPPDEVVDYYNALVAKREAAALSVEQRRRKDGWLLTRSGTDEIRITHAELRDASSGLSLATVQVEQSVELVVRLRADVAVPSLVLGIMLRDRTGHVVWGSNTWHTHQVVHEVPAGAEYEVIVSMRASIGPGSYGVTCAAHTSDSHTERNYQWVDNFVVFDVVNTDKVRFIGSTYLDATFRVSRLADAA
jgi:lipopolysaccharide transport system ATP-binding protein